MARRKWVEKKRLVSLSKEDEEKLVAYAEKYDMEVNTVILDLIRKHLPDVRAHK
jgi:hypothetical protein